MSPTGALLLLLGLSPCLVSGQNKIMPPKLNISYKAMGEMVQAIEDSTFQVAFEEHFDASTNNSEFTVWEIGKSLTFLENGKTNQTLLYEDDSDCHVITKKEFIEIGAPPSFMGYSDPSGRIRFSLKHLLDLDPKKIIEWSVKTQFRNISAVYWAYELQGKKTDKNTKIVIYSYWTDGSWIGGSDTPSANQQVPLGFVLNNITMVSGKPVTTSQFVNVFAFMRGVVDKKAFRPREGIYCKDRVHPYKLPVFPLVKSYSLRSEYLDISAQDISGVDVYSDTTDGLHRVDINVLDPYSGDTGPRPLFTSKISSKELGLTFKTQLLENKWSCTVSPLDKYQLENAELFNPKLDLDKWSIHALIGESTTKYVFVGNTYKRNIPCKLYHGIRQDWPQPDSSLTTLWEWCFSFMVESGDEDVYFRDDEIGLIYLSVVVLEDQSKVYPANYRLVHNFYDVVNENPANMTFNTFDLKWCFSQENKKFLEFAVNVAINDKNIHVMENATSDLHFLIAWKEAIAKAAGINLKTLRISTVQSFVFKNKLYVNLILLGKHDSLPDKFKNSEPSLNDAISSLEKVINKGDLKISYTPSPRDKPLVLAASKNSLVKSFVKPPYDRLTTTTTTPTTTTRGTVPTISIIIDDTTSSTSSGPTDGKTGSDDVTVSTESTSDKGNQGSSSSGSIVTPTMEIKADKVEYEGHQPGTVAGVSIAMLLLGLSVGAGGTFYSQKGMPSFLRFR